MTKKYTQMIKIQRKSFIEIIKQNKDDYEKFMEIKDKILFDKNIKAGKKIKCYACKSYEHIFSDCNKVQFDKNNSFIIHRYLRHIEQDRNMEYKRYRPRTNNSRSLQKSLSNQIYQFQEMNDLGSTTEDYMNDSQSFFVYNQNFVNEQPEEEEDEAKQNYEIDNTSEKSDSNKENSNMDYTINNANSLINYGNQNSSDLNQLESGGGGSNQIKIQKSVFEKQRKESQNKQLGLYPNLIQANSKEIFNIPHSAVYGDHNIVQNGDIFFNNNWDKYEKENLEELDLDKFQTSSPLKTKKLSKKMEDNMNRIGNKKQTIGISKSQSVVNSPKSSLQDKKYAQFSPQLNQPDDLLNRNLQFPLLKELKSGDLNSSSIVIGGNSNYPQKRRQSFKLSQKVVDINQQQSQQFLQKIESKRKESRQQSLLEQQNQQYYQIHDHKKAASLLNSDQIKKEGERYSFLKQRQSILYNPLYLQQRLESGQYLEGDKEQYIWKFDKMKDFTFYFPYYNLQNVLKRWYQNYYLKINKKNKKLKLKQTTSYNFKASLQSHK